MTTALAVEYRQMTVNVNIIVLRDHANKGNDKWVNVNYVKGFLNEASIADKTVDFNLKSLSIHKNTAAYKDLNQITGLRLATTKSRKSEITVVITNEKTTSSAGLSWVQLRYNPAFAMRSRNYGADQYSQNVMKLDAAIFLHEMGHNMDLSHNGAGRVVHTDNYTKVDAGVVYGRNYYQKLTGQDPIIKKGPIIIDPRTPCRTARLGIRCYEP